MVERNTFASVLKRDDRMEAVIARIMKIEKQSAVDIERAEEACRKNIEVHRLALEKEKERAQTLIITKENTRSTEALRVLNKQAEETFLAECKDHDSLFHDPVDAVKEKIVAILLAG
jgi:hypothetical protein